MIIGICGKIASGKSEVMKILAEHGFKIVDADSIVHDLYEPGMEGSLRIAEEFGEDYANDDAGVDRMKLRELIFCDDSKVGLLNSLIHPLVYNKIKKMELKGNVAIESVYFDENLLLDFVDKLIWVDRKVEDCKRVLILDRDFDPDSAQCAIELIEKPKKIDFVIKNHGSLDDLKQLVLSTLDL